MEFVWRSFFCIHHLAVKKLHAFILIERLRTSVAQIFDRFFFAWILRHISVWSQNGGTFEKLHATQREKWRFSIQSQTSATNETFFFWERTRFITLWLRDVIYWLQVEKKSLNDCLKQMIFEVPERKFSCPQKFLLDNLCFPQLLWIFPEDSRSCVYTSKSADVVDWSIWLANIEFYLKIHF